MPPRKKSGVRTYVFVGGVLDGERNTVLDPRRPYFGWWQFPPPGVSIEGEPRTDRYEYDVSRDAFVYIGTMFGHEDQRSMRRMKKEEVARWLKQLQPPRKRPRRP